jgi:hypothetical protein
MREFLWDLHDFFMEWGNVEGRRMEGMKNVRAKGDGLMGNCAWILMNSQIEWIITDWRELSGVEKCMEAHKIPLEYVKRMCGGGKREIYNRRVNF